MTHRFTLALVILCLIAPMTVLAQKKESGRYTTIRESNETIELPDGRTFEQGRFTMISFADEPGSLFANLRGDCTGNTVFSKEGEPIAASGYCFQFDAESDGHWFWYRMEEAGTPQCPGMCGIFEIYDSYGKFQDCGKAIGTWRVFTRFPDGTALGMWELTYEMK